MKNISIEGLIGSGKTSLLRMIEKELKGAVVVYEPVEEWRDYNGVNVLQEFYNKPDKNALGFQLFVANSFIKSIKKAVKVNSKGRMTETRLIIDKPKFVVSDRCALSGVYQFSKMLKPIYETPYVFDSLKEMVEMSLGEYRPNIIVYVKVDVRTAMTRINVRGRSEEKKISDEYQQQLKDNLEIWIEDEKKKGNVVIILDGEASTEDVFKEFCRKINKFLI